MAVSTLSVEIRGSRYVGESWYSGVTIKKA